MDTGEYKFICPRTLIKEKDVSKGEKADVNRGKNKSRNKK